MFLARCKSSDIVLKVLVLKTLFYSECASALLTERTSFHWYKEMTIYTTQFEFEEIYPWYSWTCGSFQDYWCSEFSIWLFFFLNRSYYKLESASFSLVKVEVKVLGEFMVNCSKYNLSDSELALLNKVWITQYPTHISSWTWCVQWNLLFKI